MSVRYKVRSAWLLQMAIAGIAGALCLLAFWTRSNVGGLLKLFSHNWFVASASLLLAIAIHVVFLPVAYIGLGALIFHRTATGAFESWSPLDSGHSGMMRRVVLRLSDKDIHLRVDESVLKLLESSPPRAGTAMEAKFGPIGILLQLKW